MSNVKATKKSWGYEITYRYCVIDLSGGAKAKAYPVRYLEKEPKDGFNTIEYQTKKLVLKRVEAGSFIMGDKRDDESRRVTLTKPFYMGLFEVTQRQWELVMGTNPSSQKGETRPVDRVSYDMIRGNVKGAKWPASGDVDKPSFLGKLRMKSGIAFDLPTEAQWEYACRAGTKTRRSFGDDSNSDDYMWHNGNSGDRTREVGMLKPNPWGFYECTAMCGSGVWTGSGFLPMERIRRVRRPERSELVVVGVFVKEIDVLRPSAKASSLRV